MDRILSMVVVACALVLGTVEPVRAQSANTTAFNLTAAVREAVAAGTCSAPQITGRSHSATYNITNAFDGVTVSTASNPNKRWLGFFSSNNADGSFYALYRVPDEFRPGEVFVLNSYTLWRSNYNEYDPARVPTKWAIFGVDSDGTETLLSEVERTIDTWGRKVTDETRSATFKIPDGQASSRGYRAFKFVPYATASSDTVNFALFELEFTVQAVSTSLISDYAYDRDSRLLTVTATIDNPGEPVDLALEVVSMDGSVVTNNLAKGVSDATTSYPLGPLEPGSYRCTLLARMGQNILSSPPKAIYTGTVTIVPGSNAAAESAQNGSFTISRAPVGPFSDALDIPIVAGGTAVAGQNYVALPSFITIPAGETSVTLTVTPIPNRNVTDTRTLSVTLEDGDYTLLQDAAEISIIPPTPAFYHWTYADGTITRPDNTYSFTVAADGNRLAITGGTYDPFWPELNLDDPVLDKDGNPYTIVAIRANNKMQEWQVTSLILPRTLEIVTSYSMSKWEKLKRLVMRCPRLSTIGYAFLSGFDKTIPLTETTLDDWDLSGLVTLGGGSLNSYQGRSGVQGLLVLPKLQAIGDNSLSAYRFREIRLESRDLHTISNSFKMSTLTNVYFATTRNLTLGPTAINNGKIITTYTFDGPPQSPDNLDLLTSSSKDWQITIHASRAQGWASIPNLVREPAAIAELLTEEEKTLYAGRLADPNLLGVLVTPTTGRKVWLLHRASPYDATLIIFR